jgi:hypothetical protein
MRKRREGDWEILQKYSGFNLMIMLLKGARTSYEKYI